MVARNQSKKHGPARRNPGSSALPSRLTPMALAILGALSASPVQADNLAPFQSMVALQAGMVRLSDGTMSQWSGADRPVLSQAADGRDLMTIRQTQQKALLDWERFELQANEILEFQQQRADWIAVNRVHSNSASRIDGEIRAIGRVFILNDNGVLMGEGATINTRQLVTGRGVSDVLVDGTTTTIVQSKDKAILDWSDMSSQAGEVLRFQQQKNDWIALNRSHLTGQATTLKGDIDADGQIVMISREGLSVDGDISAQQVVLSSLDMRDKDFLDVGLISRAENYNGRYDPTFSNSWRYVGSQSSDYGLTELLDPAPVVVDPDDPLRYNVTVGRDAEISTDAHGKIMLFGPGVTNKGTLRVQDEGQVVLAAGDNIYLARDGNTRDVSVFVGAYNPLTFGRNNISYRRPAWRYGSPLPEEWVDLLEAVSGIRYEAGSVVPAEEREKFFANTVIDGVYQQGGYFGRYLDRLQAERAEQVGFHARNDGVIEALRGGSVDFRGFNLEQMGAVTMTSTASFRGDISFTPIVQDYREYANGDNDGTWGLGSNGPAVPGHGHVVFGKGSLTQITPDLEATDTLPVSEGAQSVGRLKINARSVHMQEDALIYMPSGEMDVLLDAGSHVYDNNRGNGANMDNEDGTRFMMEQGATIDLSGWDVTLEMGYHQVTGKLFAAQLKDAPLQRDGALYRKEISIDRRYGTNVADWESFDNLSQGTLSQFLTDGGRFTMDAGDDFIMKSGSVIDVSGGTTTYRDGFVYTTLLRRLDGSVIDIREADPDELYMGLANEWVKYDTKWGRQQTYYIPLMSSVQGKYETSYVHGGDGGSIDILAPDTILHGTLRGETTAGRYQRANLPTGGSFKLNIAGQSEPEYVSNNLLIAAIEKLLPSDFGMRDKLSDLYGNFFGEEFDHETDAPASNGRTMDNATLTSADFFNRSTMGSYTLGQGGRVGDAIINEGGVVVFPPTDGIAVLVEDADIHLANGASLAIRAEQRMQFLGSVRTEGGDVDLSAMSLEFAPDSVLDTRGGWYSDYELNEPVALAGLPRIHGGSITLHAGGDMDGVTDDVRLVLPETMVIDTTGGAWVDRDGKITNGKGGDLSVGAGAGAVSEIDLAGLQTARALGLGGNGALTLNLFREIYLGEAMPQEAASDAVLLKPAFFEHSGFSGITLNTTQGITLIDGTRINASSAGLQLRDSTLHNGVPSAYYAPSGTDIYDIAVPRYLTPEQRPAGQRDGMDLTLNGNGGSVTIGKNSVLAAEAGGNLSLIGNAIDVHGTLQVLAGDIALTGPSVEDSRITVHGSGRLLAPGAVRVLKRSVDAGGGELLDGEVLAGGRISLDATELTLANGALLDVSGASAVFNEPRTGARRTLVSDGGSITVRGSALNVNDATLRAHAGGAGARGGSFSLSWGAGYELERSQWAPTPETVYDNFGWYFDGGAFNDIDGNPVTSFFGTDLSRIDWNLWGMPYDFVFPAGFTVGSREELEALLLAYDAAVLGQPPVLMVGNDLPPAGGGEAAPLPVIEPALRQLLEQLGGYEFVEPSGGPAPIAQLSPGRLTEGGFSRLSLDAAPGILFVGDAVLGGYRADGSHVFDRIDILTPRLMGEEGADALITAEVVTLSGSETAGGGGGELYDLALADMGVRADNADTRLAIDAGALLQVSAANFFGYSDVALASQGDIRLHGIAAGSGPDSTIRGGMTTAGNLSLKADQIYATTANHFTIRAGDTLTILPQDEGTPINVSPYEAGAVLTLEAPRIVQGGTLRSPLGTINLVGVDDGSEGANSITLLPGSLTSVSAEGKVIPYGVTVNGDTWTDPVTGLEMTQLPEKQVNLTADTLDLQEGAVLDVAGGGDLYAWEFVPGIGGSTDWLTGYRDQNYDWVEDSSEIFAVLPGYDADLAPVGLGNGSQIGLGEKIWLSGGSGLKAGYYTLLPARYALLPGAYRVTARHQYAGVGEMPAGTRRNLADGSSIQAGYRITPNADGSVRYQEQRNQGYLVMPGSTLRQRSQYIETGANGFYLSDAFLKKALRTNRPVGEIPRIPLDGGSVVLDAGRIQLDATLQSAAAPGGRGGFADIKGDRILVASAGTDLQQYEGYLVLDSDRLTSFGAESLLLGGVRRQGEVNVEIEVGATDIVIDNQGATLTGAELLFASRGDIRVKDGAAVETRGEVSGSSGDLRIVAMEPALIDDNGTSDPGDDILVHGELDQGAVLRLSSSEQVNILRKAAAVDEMAALAADPVALAAVNAQRIARGLSPLEVRGNLIVESGARLIASQSIALDATHDTHLDADATLVTPQISASASRVSIGDVPTGTDGLVFAGGSLGALAAAEDILLKSYSSIDFHGAATLRAEGSLTLDSRELRVLNADGGTVTVAGEHLTLTNTNGGEASATAGDAKLRLEGRNIYLEGEGKWLSGMNGVTLLAEERVIGRDAGSLYVPGALTVEAAALTADSGARLSLAAQDDVHIVARPAGDLPAFETFGATIDVTGASVLSEGAISLTGGTVNLRAREGDVRLASGASIDVTSNTSRIFDVDVGVGGGTVNLTADRGDIDLSAGAVIDVSGTGAGGDAGSLNMSAGLGNVHLSGEVRGDAQPGYRSGSFSMLSQRMADFSGLNAQLDAGGFRQSLRFEINEGDVEVSGSVQVQDFGVVANDGAINVTGTIETVGDDGGRIQLAAARSVTLASGARLLARATTDDGSGGTVFLETVGRDGGEINVAAGAAIDVSGTGEGGRTVRLRAPQVNGDDVAIAPVLGIITGARSVIAEGFRVYDDVGTIDQGVIDTVSADASDFMAHAAAIQQRLGGEVTVAPGIELRSTGDMELVEDWDLHTLRFGSEQSAGVLTLRAAGNLLINANLSDGFDGATAEAALLDGESWTLNLTSGANVESPNSLAVLPQGQLAEDKGSLIVGGTPDTLEFYRIELTDGTIEHRLFRKDANGNFLRDPAEFNPYLGFFELERDAATGLYIDPDTGELIQKDAGTGDYADTAQYGRMPLPWMPTTQGGYRAPDVFYSSANASDLRYGQPRNAQWDNSTGYLVRTGTAGINLASGRDVVLEYRPSVIYTAGESAPGIEYFHAPTRLPGRVLPYSDPANEVWLPMSGYYTRNGGDISLRAQGDVIGAGSNQLPTGWLWRYGVVDYGGGGGDFRSRETSHKHLGRDYEQTTWFVRFDQYQAGIGALGGGNIDIEAAGNVHNLTVNIPNTGRVSGGYDGIERQLHLTGGGNLSLRAGGDIGSANIYVADGSASLTAGGAFTSTQQVMAQRQVGFGGVQTGAYDLYSMLFTSSGQLRLQSGGDLNLDIVADPFNMQAGTFNLYGSGGRYGPDGVFFHEGDSRNSGDFAPSFVSYTPEASIELFSAGGDVKIWNNYGNAALLNKAGSYLEPLHYFVGPQNPYTSAGSTVAPVWPGMVSAVAAAGSVEIKGGMVLAPATQGNLSLLARRNVLFGQTTRADDPYAWLNQDAQNYFPGFGGILMSQTRLELLPTALSPVETYGQAVGESFLGRAGYVGNLAVDWSIDYLPDLHAGDAVPARIYAAEGDIVTTQAINLPKALWVQAGNHVYFPDYRLQHNNPNDLSLIRAGNGLYFTESGQVAVNGPGRLEIETGHDLWIPSNVNGITSNGIAFTDPNPYDTVPAELWRPDELAADIAISTGFNQAPDYAAFEAAYLDPALAAEIADYLKADAGDGRELPVYLFDRLYARGNGSTWALASDTLAAGFVNYMRGLEGLPPLATADEQNAWLGQAWAAWLALPVTQQTPFDTLMPRMSATEAARKGARPEFYLAERREGLVNYVRRLQGLEALQTQAEQLAYMDEALAYWDALRTDDKTPFYRNVLFMELRSTGREANDPDSDRNNSTFRGYEAIATLFPGAEKRGDEALEEGESRWQGDFETFASRVISNGGGKIEFVIPGGALKLANVAARPEDVGQPVPLEEWQGGGMSRGDALRAGLITQNGGEINLFTGQSVTVNESRILTTKGGNVLVWSSYGDIAAGKGAKTSISPQFYDYALSNWAHMTRTPAGLPTGAGIGTLASQAGTPPADVDLIAPNGIVDAGDAGLRVSGNFNVFAVQILGTDNIDVSGVSTGLPTPPAAPPTSLDVDDAAAKGARVLGALNDSLEKARDNVKGPSIIEVKVLGYGEECVSDRENCDE